MHFSWAVLLPRRQVGNLCLPHLPRVVLHNSYLRSHDRLFAYGEIVDHIFAFISCLALSYTWLVKVTPLITLSVIMNLKFEINQILDIYILGIKANNGGCKRDFPILKIGPK